MHYKLGADALKSHIMDAGRNWAEFGQRRPAARQAVVVGVGFVCLFVVVGGMAPEFAHRSASNLRGLLGGSQVSS